ncbi:retropepsin-like aspartic protease [Effusibacillus dendaii]|nr:retropepsin-like aspartic protease [Effusibacillus dendaii]
MISADAVEELNIGPEKDDKIVVMRGIGGKQRSLRKKVDGVRFGSFEINEMYVDFGLLDSDIDGLIGLDILLSGRFIIDLANMEIYRNRS